MIEQAPGLDKNSMQKVIDFAVDPSNSTILNKINSEYLYWDKVKYQNANGVDPVILWNAVKLQRRMNIKSVQFGNRNFYFNITPTILKFLHEFDVQMGGSFVSDVVIPENEKKIYLVSSIMEEAIASCQMEGASTTRKVAKDMLRKNKSPENKSQQMIVNNYQTIQQLVTEKDKDFSIDSLLEIHHSISQRTLDDPKDEGRIRQDDNILVMDAITGDIAHTPPSYTEVYGLLDDLCKFANSKEDAYFIHPIVKGIIIHFILAWIHPFVDGNGRTARSLVYWYLLKKGYWLTEYLSISRIIYKNKPRYEKVFLYTESDNMDMTYFILYNLQVMKQAYADLKDYLARMMTERKKAFVEIQDEGLNDRQKSIIKIMEENKGIALSAKEVSVRFAITEKTSRADLQSLVALGYLKQIQVNKKQRIYVKA